MAAARPATPLLIQSTVRQSWTSRNPLLHGPFDDQRRASMASKERCKGMPAPCAVQARTTGPAGAKEVRLSGLSWPLPPAHPQAADRVVRSLPALPTCRRCRRAPRTLFRQGHQRSRHQACVGQVPLQIVLLLSDHAARNRTRWNHVRLGSSPHPSVFGQYRSSQLPTHHLAAGAASNLSELLRVQRRVGVSELPPRQLLPHLRVDTATDQGSAAAQVHLSLQNRLHAPMPPMAQANCPSPSKVLSTQRGVFSRDILAMPKHRVQ